MIQIPLSLAGNPVEFAKACEVFRAALEAHRLAAPGQPAPRAIPLIEGLIRIVPDTGPVATRGPDRFLIEPYEVVDDTPPAPPPPTLEERKRDLALQLQQAAAAARDAILSPARVNLLNLEYVDAVSKPELSRSQSDIAAIAAVEEFQGRCADINRIVARAAVDLEERTESTLESWSIPSF